MNFLKIGFPPIISSLTPEKAWNRHPSHSDSCPHRKTSLSPARVLPCSWAPGTRYGEDRMRSLPTCSSHTFQCHVNVHSDCGNGERSCDLATEIGFICFSIHKSVGLSAESWQVVAKEEGGQALGERVKGLRSTNCGHRVVTKDARYSTGDTFNNIVVTMYGASRGLETSGENIL